MPGKQVTDRRIQKTKNLLHEALGSLIREKPYDTIVVQEILDHANVGRSTFYMYFRDKDDLLVSGIHDMLRSVNATELPSSGKRYERVTRFSLPIFEHIHQHRHTGGAKMGTRGRAIIHEYLQRVLAQLIGDDVTKDFQDRRKTPAEIPPDLIVQYVASTFILVLNWWVETSSPLPPKEVNDLFRALILPSLASPGREGKKAVLSCCNRKQVAGRHRKKNAASASSPSNHKSFRRKGHGGWLQRTGATPEGLADCF